MSWLARSIANSLKLDDDDDVEVDEHNHSPTTSTDINSTSPNPESDHDKQQSTAHTPRGVKEDLTELTKSFSRQLWGVASFLAPPPQPEHPISDPRQPSDPDASGDEAVIDGIKSDFAEISGKFKTGISKLSENISVSEITKMASNFLQFGSETEPMDAVGVTEEVLLFARDITMHPETWLDFPVPDEEEFDEFDMSDAQQEHALAVERLAPRLAALRIELCPEHMSESCFWKIYFVLLHPRLSKGDAELLSTPQIVEARAMLAHELKSRAKVESESVNSGTSTYYLNKPAGSGTPDLSESAELAQNECLSVPSRDLPATVPLETSAIESAAADSETEKHPVLSTEMLVVDKSVVKEEQVEMAELQKSISVSSDKVVEVKFEDHDDDWLKEDNSEEVVGVSGSTMHLENDEDVSFSDLEEEDEDMPTSYKKVTSGSDSLTKDPRDWVQLSGDSVKDIKPVGSQQVSAPAPETKESNDWLDFDDIGEM
ncbi:hypothetical protein Dsin_015709 [Dipteronia sinensis]|uniref:BSD domain-containing protein n=1 Tax=Dipteronia sinensis TaxID=43782 RepID=A0AAE0ACN2_9ROSI|nr:hypothetical protein Dsin_015709 [Dipteronia sinensis]